MAKLFARFFLLLVLCQAVLSGYAHATTNNAPTISVSESRSHARQDSNEAYSNQRGTNVQAGSVPSKRPKHLSPPV